MVDQVIARLHRSNQLMHRLAGVDEVLLFLLELVFAVVIVVLICRLAIVRPWAWPFIRAQVVFADTSVRFLPEYSDPRVVQAMTTINGKEDVSQPQ
jgi:hypothetical protein